MQEIEVGEYVRTKNGTIFIYTEEFAKDLQAQDFSLYNDGKIIKHSKNIIDLIQVGDYVNGYKVCDKESTLLFTNIYGIDRSGYHVPISQYGENIKSIVTKKQFESIEYKI